MQTNRLNDELEKIAERINYRRNNGFYSKTVAANELVRTIELLAQAYPAIAPGLKEILKSYHSVKL